MTRTRGVLALVLAVAVLAGARAATPASMASGIRDLHVVPSPSAPGDSALIVATWARGCDLRGCPSSYTVSWARGTATAPMRERGITVDTFAIAWPAWGDSVLVSVTVRAVRRGQTSSPSMGSAMVRRPDAAPPAPDSLRVIVDTMAIAAWRDSFPASDWQAVPGSAWQYALEDGTDSLPLPSWDNGITVAEGFSTRLCVAARNKYSGAFALLVPIDVTDEAERAEHIVACRSAVERVAAQRDV